MSESNSATATAVDQLDNTAPAVDQQGDNKQNTTGTANVVPMEPDDQLAVRKRMAQEQRLADAHSNFRTTLEECGHFTDLGVVYAAGSPIENSVGAEFGIVTKDDKTGVTSRSGIGVYIRCDHWSMAFAPTPANEKFAG
jgi:hypothetical protein